MQQQQHALRRAIAALLVVTAALFAIATSLERNAEAEHASQEAKPVATDRIEPSASPVDTVDPTHPADESVPHSEEGETHEDEEVVATDAHDEADDPLKEEPEGAHDESEESEGAHSEPGEAGHDENAEASETIFGIDMESPGMVALGVVVSLMIATLIWLKPSPWVFALGALFGLAFAILDGREVLHQLDEDRTVLAIFAGAIAIGHGSAALLSVVATRRRMA